jgi:hypothetical protein
VVALGRCSCSRTSASIFCDAGENAVEANLAVYDLDVPDRPRRGVGERVR